MVTVTNVHVVVVVEVVVVVAMLVGMATAVIITHQASWQLTHFFHSLAYIFPYDIRSATSHRSIPHYIAKTRTKTVTAISFTAALNHMIK